MGIEFEVVYNDSVIDIDIPKLSASDKKRIKDAIENKLIIRRLLISKYATKMR